MCHKGARSDLLSSPPTSQVDEFYALDWRPWVVCGDWMSHLDLLIRGTWGTEKGSAPLKVGLGDEKSTWSLGTTKCQTWKWPGDHAFQDTAYISSLRPSGVQALFSVVRLQLPGSHSLLGQRGQKGLPWNGLKSASLGHSLRTRSARAAELGRWTATGWDEAGPSDLCCSRYTWNSKKVLAITHWGLEADERQTKTVRDLDQRGRGNWVSFLHTAAIAREHRIWKCWENLY